MNPFSSVFQMNFMLTERDKFTAIERLCVLCVCCHLQQKLCCAVLSPMPYRIAALHVETLHFRTAYGVRRCSSSLSPNKVHPILFEILSKIINVFMKFWCALPPRSTTGVTLGLRQMCARNCP